MTQRQFGFQIKRRIAALDPERDHEEISRLALEVLYGDPIFVHAGYLIGFSRQMAVPSIARTVYRAGRGDMVSDGARRTADTLTFFGEFFRRGPSSPEGRAAIARMERIHSRFPITDEEKLYTLSSLVFEGARIAEHLGFEPFAAGELEANWHFWAAIAREMPLEGVPSTWDDYWRWMLEYEREHWRFTPAGRAVVDGVFEDWTRRWFPPRARRLGRQFLLALMDGEHRAVHRLEAPPKSVERLVRAGARAYFALTPYRPLRLDRSRVDYFGRRYGPTPDFENVGHQAQPAGPQRVG